MPSITIQRIDSLCNENNITITSLESMIDIAKGSIRRWGKFNPSIDKIIKIADYFHVSTDYLLGLSNFRHSVDDEENDKGLVSLKRARSKMPDSDRRRMDKLLLISFSNYFKDNNNDDTN